MKAKRDWVDNQTSILGRDSVNINVANNTHIKGAKIANEKKYGSGNIDKSQNFIAVGPAVSEKQWNNVVDDVNKKLGRDYIHDEQDSILYLTTPRSLSDVVRGVVNIPNIGKKHGVAKNNDYNEPLREN